MYSVSPALIVCRMPRHAGISGFAIGGIGGFAIGGIDGFAVGGADGFVFGGIGGIGLLPGIPGGVNSLSPIPGIQSFMPIRRLYGLHILLTRIKRDTGMS